MNMSKSSNKMKKINNSMFQKMKRQKPNKYLSNKPEMGKEKRKDKAKRKKTRSNIKRKKRRKENSNQRKKFFNK